MRAYLQVPMNHPTCVRVADGFHDRPHCLPGIRLTVPGTLHDRVKQLATSTQFLDDIDTPGIAENVMQAYDAIMVKRFQDADLFFNQQALLPRDFLQVQHFYGASELTSPTPTLINGCIRPAA